MRPLTLLLLLLLEPSRVHTTITPTAVPVGGSIRITCSVPRHPDNRWLHVGAFYDDGAPYRDATDQLDGESARVTHTMLVEHVPCDVGMVMCAVEDNLGRVYRDVRPLVVAGCAHPDDLEGH